MASDLLTRARKDFPDLEVLLSLVSAASELVEPLLANNRRHQLDLSIARVKSALAALEGEVRELERKGGK